MRQEIKIQVSTRTAVYTEIKIQVNTRTAIFTEIKIKVSARIVVYTESKIKVSARIEIKIYVGIKQLTQGFRLKIHIRITRQGYKILFQLSS